MRNITKNCFTFFFLLLCLGIASLTGCAQKQTNTVSEESKKQNNTDSEKSQNQTGSATENSQNQTSIVSGDYGSFLLGIDSDGKLTGYFSERTSNASCDFYISGEKQSDGSYSIKTWYPGYKGDEIINGKIKLVGEKGEKIINLKLDSEPGGCGNSYPMIARDNGNDFELTEAGNWESIRVISASKSYFYKSAEAKAPQKVYVVRDDVVRVNQTKGTKANVTFVNDEGRKTSGWINTRDFYGMSAPSANKKK